MFLIYLLKSDEGGSILPRCSHAPKRLMMFGWCPSLQRTSSSPAKSLWSSLEAYSRKKAKGCCNVTSLHLSKGNCLVLGLRTAGAISHHQGFGNLYCLKQSFSASPQMMGAGVTGSCLEHWRMFSDIPDLHSIDTSKLTHFPPTQNNSGWELLHFLRHILGVVESGTWAAAFLFFLSYLFSGTLVRRRTIRFGPERRLMADVQTGGSALSKGQGTVVGLWKGAWSGARWVLYTRTGLESVPTDQVGQGHL